MSDDKTTGSTALAVRKPVSMAAYEPRDYPQAMQIAATMGKAAGLTPEVAYLKMAAGAEYGIPAVTALRLIDIIDGPNGTKQPAPRAQLMVALCLREPTMIEYFERVDSNMEKATWRAKRVGRPEQVVSFSVEDAKRAKLIKDGGAWQKDPESQCNARASARLARIVAPDIVGGMYAAEERDSVESTVAAVSPLPSQTVESTVVDAAPEEAPESDEERIGLALGAASDAATLARLFAEATKLWPKSTSPVSVKQAYKAAKARIEGGAVPAGSGVPPHDATTGEVSREPGEEG